MYNFCGGCEYLKDNPALGECCTHKEFCERAYKKGMMVCDIISTVTELPPSDTKYLFTVNNNYPTGITEDIAMSVKEFLSPLECIFVPENIVSYVDDTFAVYNVRNKFHYKEDEWILTSDDGKLFSSNVKDTISELIQKDVMAYNEFEIFVRKKREDYRNARNTEADEG